MADDVAPVYLRVTDGRLWQGEILSNVVERQAARQADGSFALSEVVHPYVIITTQDCDLEQDARARADASMEVSKRQNALLDHIQLLVAYEFAKATSRFAGSDVRKRARQNKDERFHFLSPATNECDALGTGVPALLLDFKRAFSYPATELLASITTGETMRRTRLATPYVEHLASRCGYFTQRIALPRDHHDLDEQAKPRALPPVPEQ